MRSRPWAGIAAVAGILGVAKILVGFTPLGPASVEAAPPIAARAPVWPAAHLSTSIVQTDGTADPRLVVLIVDKLTFEDFIQFPDDMAAWEPLIKRADVAMMNVRTEGSAQSAAGYLSLAVGVRAQAGARAGLAYMRDEEVDGQGAAAVYEGLTGRASEQTIVHLGIGELARMAVPRSSLLGDVLSAHGLVAAVLGNSDSPGETQRLAALLAVDRHGLIAHGDIDGTLLKSDPEFPGGRRTDHAALLQRVIDLSVMSRRSQSADAMGPPHVLIIDIGDLARLERHTALALPEHETEMRRRALQRIGRFVRHIVDHFTGTHVVLVSPSPSFSPGREGILLTPVLHWSAEDTGSSGLLSSSTTRRPGIVTNTDFLPTVLDRLGLPSPPLLGRSWHTVPHERPFAYLLDQYTAIKTVHLQRLPVIQPYFFGVLGLFGVGGLLAVRSYVLTAGGRSMVMRPLYHGMWRFILTACAAVPGALLLVSALPPASLPSTFAAIGFITGGTAIVARGISRWSRLDAIGVIAGGTALLLVGDIVAGAPLMQGSLLGYDPVAGSRFYGIGNEYMGVLIGAALTALGFTIDRLSLSRRGRGMTPAVTLGLVAVLLLHPRLGINVGGAITALSAAGAAAMFGLDWTWTWKKVAAAAIGISVVIIGTALLDARLFQNYASHLGNTVHSISAGGGDPLWSLFGRKIAVNIKLIRLTIWSRVVFIAFIFLGLVLYVPNWLARPIIRRQPALWAMSKASVVASVIALVVNDSGVVAAATLLVWPTLALLSVAFDPA